MSGCSKTTHSAEKKNPKNQKTNTQPKETTKKPSEAKEQLKNLHEIAGISMCHFTFLKSFERHLLPFFKDLLSNLKEGRILRIRLVALFCCNFTDVNEFVTWQMKWGLECYVAREKGNGRTTVI